MGIRTKQNKNGTALDSVLDADGISAVKHSAILALLKSPTLTEAAQTAHVSRQSLYRWLKEPGFRMALKRARHQAVRHASAYVQGISGKAAATLLEVMEDTKASAASRVSASRIALEMTFQLIEADEFAERLKNLERLQRRDGDDREPEW